MEIELAVDEKSGIIFSFLSIWVGKFMLTEFKNTAL
jgi:hypothetical protein